jgi:hypothetical protein
MTGSTGFITHDVSIAGAAIVLYLTALYPLTALLPGL